MTNIEVGNLLAFLVIGAWSLVILNQGGGRLCSPPDRRPCSIEFIVRLY